MIFLLCYLSKYLQALYHPILHNEPPTRVLQGCLTRDVEGQVLGLDSCGAESQAWMINVPVITERIVISIQSSRK